MNYNHVLHLKTDTNNDIDYDIILKEAKKQTVFPMEDFGTTIGVAN